METPDIRLWATFLAIVVGIVITTTDISLGILILCLCGGLLLVYLVNPKMVTGFFSETPDPEQASVTAPRDDIVREGNLYLTVWVVWGIAVIILAWVLFTYYFLWAREHGSWILFGCLIALGIFFLIEQGYHQKAAALSGWTSRSPDELAFRAGAWPLTIVTGVLIVTALLVAWGLFVWFTPQYAQNNFMITDPQIVIQYFQATPVVCIAVLGIVYFLFRLK